ncbi:hypothetical protein MKMG_01286 [Methanogenium sp. MK-MG]|nr:hypothetical protein MKMG_01286 [Methanogenium sp. MK-MG]
MAAVDGILLTRPVVGGVIIRKAGFVDDESNTDGTLIHECLLEEVVVKGACSRWQKGDVTDIQNRREIGW